MPDIVITASAAGVLAGVLAGGGGFLAKVLWNYWTSQQKAWETRLDGLLQAQREERLACDARIDAIRREQIAALQAFARALQDADVGAGPSDSDNLG